MSPQTLNPELREYMDTSPGAKNLVEKFTVDNLGEKDNEQPLMNPDPVKIIDAFIDVNNDLTKLYEKKAALLNTVVKNWGNISPMIKQNEDGTWTRIVIQDNQERMKDGYYEFVRVERYSVKIDNLKNKPKELKDV